VDFTVVTVVHRTDLTLIKLQARSLSRYLDRSFVREIIVIDNTVGEKSIQPGELLPQYGSLPVRLIARYPVEAKGWYTQQVQKLMIARQITTPYYLLLDAKNHLVRRITRATFVAPDGRLRLGAYGYRHHPLHNHLLHSCRFFGIDPKHLLDSFVQTVTPFPLTTLIVTHLLDYVERNGQPFEATFLQAGVTEFFLFAAYLLANGQRLEDHYAFDTWYSANLWKWHCNERMRQEISRAYRFDFFSVHRGAFRHMEFKTQALLAFFWYKRRLFASYTDAIRFVRGCGKTYA